MKKYGHERNKKDDEKCIRNKRRMKYVGVVHTTQGKEMCRSSSSRNPSIRRCPTRCPLHSVGPSRGAHPRGVSPAPAYETPTNPQKRTKTWKTQVPEFGNERNGDEIKSQTTYKNMTRPYTISTTQPRTPTFKFFSCK